MKSFIKFSVVVMTAILMYFTDVSIQPSRMTVGLDLVSEAQAVLGVRRRSARRGAAVGYAAGAADANAANAATAQAAQPAPAPAPAPASAAPVYGPLPVGTVVSMLPDGCTQMVANGVSYQHCGENYFQAVMQGSNLVYITAKPGG